MKKYVENISEIKEQLKQIKLPQQFQLSASETIFDVPKFIDNSLILLSTNKLTRFHRPYYDRLKRVLNTFKIEIIISEKK